MYKKYSFIIFCIVATFILGVAVGFFIFNKPQQLEIDLPTIEGRINRLESSMELLNDQNILVTGDCDVRVRYDEQGYPFFDRVCPTIRVDQAIEMLMNYLTIEFGCIPARPREFIIREKQHLIIDNTWEIQ